MAVIEWSSKYEVNVRKIDRQHRKIVDILNRLYDIQETGAERGEVQKVFDDLREYIVNHFNTEESYLKDHASPHFNEQKTEHNVFIDTICSYQKEYFQEKPVALINLFNYVWDWFSHHILTVDKKCMAGGSR